MSTPPGTLSKTRNISDSAGREAKKRKLRRGTTSCWECKKRKTKCELLPHATICVGCQNRGSKCISQEYDYEEAANLEGGVAEPEDEPTEGEKLSKRLSRLEELLEKVVARVIPDETDQKFSKAGDEKLAKRDDELDHKPPGFEFCSHTPTSMICNSTATDNAKNSPAEDVNALRLSVQTEQPRASKYQSIRQKLFDHLPCQRDADIIIGVGTNSTFLQFFTVQYGDIFAGKLRSAASMSALPTASSHPVLLARALIRLALSIQLLPPHFDTKQLRLKETPGKAMERYLEAATSLVTNNDEFVGSIEALECIVLEGVFHINDANVRRAWLLFRRAINMAQLMGIHRDDGKAVVALDPHSISSPGFLWRRILSVDRYLALILGLPDAYMGNPSEEAPAKAYANDCWLGRMDQIHSQTASRIIERNENLASENYAVTQEIDAFVQVSRKTVPADWWAVPCLRASAGTPKEMQDIMRLLAQICHFNLVLMLHVPYMLRISRERRFDYSKITCINTSRDLLLRFNTFRSFTFSSFFCRGVDMAAFTGSLTLLLAHLDNRRNNYGMDQLLTAQRLSDIALVEQTIAAILASDHHGNTLSEQITTILRSILALEADTSSDEVSLKLTIPYFGQVSIMRDGIVKSPLPNPSKLPPFSVETLPSHPSGAEVATKGQPLPTAAQLPLQPEPRSYVSPHQLPQDAGDLQLQWNGTNVITNPADGQGDGSMENWFPIDLAADVDTWALQGVDSTFFDQLLRGNGGNGNATFGGPTRSGFP